MSGWHTSPDIYRMGGDWRRYFGTREREAMEVGEENRLVFTPRIVAEEIVCGYFTILLSIITATLIAISL